jgi:DNA helicase-2/ATP-dependent DNA helicase PcrA
MTLRPTPEQQSILDFVTSRSENLIIEALAGAAKTSTLVMISHAVREPLLAIAFNKRIAVELQDRLAPTATSKTLNALGHGQLRSIIGRNPSINANKRRFILREVIDSHDTEEREALYENFSDLHRAVSFGVSCGYVPTGTHPQAKRLMDDDEFFAHSDIDFTALERAVIRKASLISIDRAFEGQCDFDDQILIPTLWPCVFPRFSLVMIDEAQDLSALQHRMLRKIARKRLIAVGDSRQAIYGFRGAHEDSMTKLRQEFSMEQLILSVSFRLPTSVAEHVRWRAPHIQSPEWAVPGEVRALPEWRAADIPDGAAVICRNNAPLFSTALRFLRAGRKPQLIGNDVVKGLIQTMRKLSKDMTLPSADALPLLDRWAAQQRKRQRNGASVDDKAECIRLFLEEEETLGLAIARAEHVANLTGTIQLMTGHKSKGLEFDEVFFLDEHLIDPERDPQADNLRYVIATRAKRRLTYITGDGYAE